MKEQWHITQFGCTGLTAAKRQLKGIYKQKGTSSWWEVQRSKVKICVIYFVWYGLIEDNDPRNLLQHKINTDRPAHSPFRLRVRLHMLLQATADDCAKEKIEECCWDSSLIPHKKNPKQISSNVKTIYRQFCYYAGVFFFYSW